jgi:hypothetical protein
MNSQENAAVKNIDERDAHSESQQSPPNWTCI